MNIVHIPRRFVRHQWGGTETVILETCRQLQAQGHKASIVCPNALATTETEDMDGVPVQRFPYFYPYLRLPQGARVQMDAKGGNLFSFHLMRELSRRPGIDLFHLHTGKRLGGIGRYVARRRNLPYVISVHGGFLDVPDAERQAWTEPTSGAVEWGKLLGWWVGSRRVFDDAAAILCVGHAETEKMRQKYPDKRVVHVPNGVDWQRFERGDGAGFRTRYGIPFSRKVILTVARFDPQKNHALAIRILRRLVTQQPDAHLLWVGHVVNQGYYEELQRLLARDNLADRVTIVSNLDPKGQDLVDAYHAADVFLLPSLHEPFGMVVLEAWAAGKPVFATRVGGLAHLIEDGRTGVLFESDNDEEAVSKMADVSPDALARLGAEGHREALARYGWDAVASQVVGVYGEVVREHSLRH